MTGHFEKGAWIADPELPPEPMVMKIRLDIDDSQVKKLKVLLEDMIPLFERMGSVIS